MAKGRNQKKKAGRLRRTREELLKDYEDAVLRCKESRERWIESQRSMARALIHKNRPPDPDAVFEAWWALEGRGVQRTAESRFRMPSPPELPELTTTDPQKGE